MDSSNGLVYLVGAGPGDPDLITVKGRRLLTIADVVLHDRLCPRALLAECRPVAELIDVGKTPGRPAMSQARINELLIQHARAGRTVVRLKGGDPFVFGRGAEELAACRGAGVDCIVIPGITSALAVPAEVGVPMTHRNVSRSFAVVTGRAGDGAELPPHDYAALARIDTLVLLMGRANLRQIASALLAAGRAPTTPAAAIAAEVGTGQRLVTAPLADIADAADRAGLAAPVVTVIGETAALARAQSDWLAARQVGRPLAGRRIAVTHATAHPSELRRLLIESGATIVDFPLLRITFPDETPALDRALRTLPEFDWVVFTSISAVRGFWRRLETLGHDACSLKNCRIAAVGPAAARELRGYGVTASLVPAAYTAESLAQALCAAHGVRGRKVLVPHGSLAMQALQNALRTAGADVIGAVAYVTDAATPTPAAVENLQAGVDAFVFCSPSGVLRFAALNLDLPRTTMACIGPTTAEAAARLGYAVDIVPDRPGTKGLVAALAAHFAGAGRSAGETPALPCDQSAPAKTH